MCPYQVCHHLLHVLGALLHLIFGTPQLDNITLVRWVWEVDDNLQEAVRVTSRKCKNCYVRHKQSLGRSCTPSLPFREGQPC